MVKRNQSPYFSATRRILLGCYAALILRQSSLVHQTIRHHILDYRNEIMYTGTGVPFPEGKREYFFKICTLELLRTQPHIQREPSNVKGT